MMFDGRRAGIAGAAFAGASTIDAVDGHDGHVLTKGHAGVAILPALLALCDGTSPGRAVDGREFLACLTLGYEIATRAGIAQHASVADYHCSGSWNSVGCAAVAGRVLAFDEAHIREALGIAEYFGPRGQMLRTTGAPSMVKDGSGWGAHVGISAAWLAREGFTGAPAVTVEDEGLRRYWADLGTRWRIREQYFKAYPVCRWAQPAVEAALALQRAHGFDAGGCRPRFDRDLSRSRRARCTVRDAGHDRGRAVQPSVSRRGRAGIRTRRRGGDRAAQAGRPARATPSGRHGHHGGDGIFAPLSAGAMGARAHRARRRPRARLRAGRGPRKPRSSARRCRASRQVFRSCRARAVTSARGADRAPRRST